MLTKYAVSQNCLQQNAQSTVKMQLPCQLLGNFSGKKRSSWTTAGKP